MINSLKEKKIKMLTLIYSPGGEIGRHKGLKIPRRKLRAGSSPALAPFYEKIIKKISIR